MNVLVLAPHPDDETIGCGGSIRLHRRTGDRVSVVFLTSGELGLPRTPREEACEIRESEAGRAAALLGFSVAEFLRLPDYCLSEESASLSRRLVPILRDSRPRQVYLPHPEEEHPDHAAVLPALRRALSELGGDAPWLLGYEVWTPLPRFDHVVDVTHVFPEKLAAVRAYASQLEAFAYDRAVIGLNQYRGALAAHCDFAEVFVTLNPRE